MKEIKEKYLPIGTVVILKGATKRLMISGFCALDNSNKDKIWDYSGCMYPEGFINTNQICLFDHDQIEKIYHIGLSNDNEEKEFKKNLNIFMEELEKANKKLIEQENNKKKTSKNTTKKKKTETKKESKGKKLSSTTTKKTTNAKNGDSLKQTNTNRKK